ncbi:L-ascorbate metabolism protein UlaG, beta-lactamase superfamily [Sinosporangium album]|uniref:L-ascorbate metabolism protein UlaG, beta-lactamase superfamily n=1 Tax=Sinosporangium album TaxID=504805 RepID=A0A1G8F6J4_9ACTN|nr:MBL fold metallo-hydrolase [Sinosporangium album]SDH77746.1 L-ascorbate metabolism protein UlaG, beta-lactamase superfamily [Sinosporangium album]
MKLTKLGHACLRLSKEGKTLVVDPGAISGESALDGADAVLITHEHFDHLDTALLSAAVAANPGLEVWTCQAVADQLAETRVTPTVVRHGDTFTSAGFDVRVIGEWHAPIHPDVQIIQNVGFMIDEEVFYPGDAFTVPEVEVPTLMVPTSAPWLKLSEMVDYLRKVRPARAFSTHDGLLNDVGLALVDNWLRVESDRQSADMRRLAVGESVTLP